MGRSLRVLAPRARAARSTPATSAIAVRVGAALIDGCGRARAAATASPLRPGRRACARRGSRRGGDVAPLKAVALGRRARAIVARYPDRSSAATRDRAGGRRRSRTGALQQLVRTVPALGCADAPATHGTFRTSRRVCPTGGDGLSTCSTSRRSIRSAASTARARTTRLSRAPDDVGSPWAIGAAEGGHKAILPELGTLEDFRPAGRQGARARHRNRPRHRLPVRARPPLRARASATGSASRPTAACSTRRIRRRSTRTSIRSTSRPSDWRALWNELKSVVEFWIGAGRAGSFASTIRTPKPFALLGMGDRRDQARASGVDLSGRGVHPAEGDAPARQARLLAVVHLLHVAQQQARADRLLHRTELGPEPRVLPAERVAQHPRHPAGDLQSGRAAGVHAAGSFSPRRWPPTTVSTGRPTSCWRARRASRAARNIATRRSISCATGDLERPDSLWSFDRTRSTASAARIPRCSPTPSLRFCTDRQ